MSSSDIVRKILCAPSSRMVIEGQAPAQARPAWRLRATGVLAAAALSMGGSQPAMADTAQDVSVQNARTLALYEQVAGAFVSRGLMSPEALSKISVAVDASCSDFKDGHHADARLMRGSQASDVINAFVVGSPDRPPAIASGERDPSPLGSAMAQISGYCDWYMPVAVDGSAFMRLSGKTSTGYANKAAERYYTIAHEMIHAIDVTTQSPRVLTESISKAAQQSGAIEIGSGVRFRTVDDLKLVVGATTKLAAARSGQQDVDSDEFASMTYVHTLTLESTADVGALHKLELQFGKGDAVKFARKLAEFRDQDNARSIESAQAATNSYFGFEGHYTVRAIHAYIEATEQGELDEIEGPALLNKYREVAARGVVRELRSNLQDKSPQNAALRRLAAETMGVGASADKRLEVRPARAAQPALHAGVPSGIGTGLMQGLSPIGAKAGVAHLPKRRLN